MREVTTLFQTMSTFTVTYKEFKNLCSEYYKNLKTADSVEKINAGFKCISIAFLNCKFENKHEQYESSILLDMASKWEDSAILDLKLNSE